MNMNLPAIGTTGRIAVLFVLVVSMFIPMAAASNHDVFSECTGGDDYRAVIECMMLPSDVEDVRPQMLLFGLVLPFLLVFAILFYGTKQVIESVPEAFIIALSISAFIIPSGGYRLVSGILLGLFGIGAGGIGGTVSGPGFSFNPDKLWPALKAARLEVAIVAGFLVALTSKLENNNVDFGDWDEIIFTMVGVWLILGGASTFVQAAIWGTVLVVGFWLLRIAGVEGSGVVGKIFGFVGLIVVGWFFTGIADTGLLPAAARPVAEQFGQFIFQGAAFISVLVVGIIAAVVILFFKYKSIAGGGS